MTAASHWYRNGDHRYPFAWESGDQPPARWHGPSEGPACYLADSPDGAWAEFLRHEEITDPEDLAGVERRIWALEVDEGTVERAVAPDLPPSVLRGGAETYATCRAEAAVVRAAGATALVAPSAALRPAGAGGQAVDGGLVEAPPRDGRVLVLYGPLPDIRGWAAVDRGRPTERVLRRTVRLA